MPKRHLMCLAVASDRAKCLRSLFQAANQNAITIRKSGLLLINPYPLGDSAEGIVRTAAVMRPCAAGRSSCPSSSVGITVRITHEMRLVCWVRSRLVWWKVLPQAQLIQTAWPNRQCGLIKQGPGSARLKLKQEPAKDARLAILEASLRMIGRL